MQSSYIKYYTQQQGGRLSAGDDEFGTVLKLPKIYQRGRGLGGVFANFWKYIHPLLQKGATFLKDELIETGADVLRNIGTQKPIKEVLRDRSVQMVDKLRDGAVNKINTMVGSGCSGRSKSRVKRKPNKTYRQKNSKRKCNSSNVKKSINKMVKRKSSQTQALAVRVKRSAGSKPKIAKHRILDIFT